MGMIYMIENPPLLADSIPSRFIIKNEPAQVRALMLEKSIDFAVLPSTMAALLYNRNQDYIFAAVPVWGTLYLFGTDSTVHNWKDLKGKTVNLIAKGMTPDIMFRYLAIHNGIDPDTDLTLDYSFPTHIELANAVKAGIANLGVISEPLVSLAEAGNPSIRKILDFNHEWIRIHKDTIPFAQTALLVKRSLAEGSPGLVREYLDSLESSIQQVIKYPADASKLIVKQGILPDTILAMKAIPGSNLGFSHAWERKEGITEYFRIFYNFNPLLLGNVIPDEDFYFKKDNQ